MVGPALTLEGVGLRFYRGAELRAVGRAHSATLETEDAAPRPEAEAAGIPARRRGDLLAHQLTLRVLGAQEGGDVELQATELAGNLHAQKADAFGGVKAIDAQGTESRTERGHFDGKQQVADGSDPVRVIGKTVESTAAAGFTLLLDEGRLLLRGPVRTVLKGAP